MSKRMAAVMAECHVQVCRELVALRTYGLAQLMALAPDKALRQVERELNEDLLPAQDLLLAIAHVHADEEGARLGKPRATCEEGHPACCLDYTGVNEELDPGSPIPRPCTRKAEALLSLFLIDPTEIRVRT